MQPNVFNALTAALLLGASYAAPTPDASQPKDNSELIGQLITTPTQIERFRKILTDASGSKLLEGDALANATVWDFMQHRSTIPGSQGGQLSDVSSPQKIFLHPLSPNLTTSKTYTEVFPFLFGAGLDISLFTVGPCGILLPHVHPRASEVFIALDNQVTFGTLLERNLFADLTPHPEIIGHLNKYSATVFPQGSVHWQVNDSENCKEFTAVAVLSSEDPGTTTVLHEPEGNRTLGRRQVGRSEFEMVRAVTPPHIAAIIDKCFARCNIA
jgi:hypothetical protein